MKECKIENCKCECHNDGECKCPCHKMMSAHHGKMHGHGGGSGAVYGMGMIGAAIYFVSTASGFWVGVLGILKAIVWPAFLVFEAFKALIG